MKLNIQLFADAGVVVIDTKVNTAGIDKGIDAIEKKLEKLRKKAEAPYKWNDIEITGGWNLSEKEQKYYDRLRTTLSQLQSKKDDMISQEKQISYETEEIVDNTNQWINGVATLKNGTQIVKKNTEETKENLKDFDKVDFSEIGKGLENIGKKALKAGLAIIGIRSAYSGIRKAISIASGENEKLANKFEQMRTVVANALAPLIDKIANAIAKIMVYINYIYKFITGKNLFNFSNVMSQAEKKSGGIAKNVKEIRKQLAGFDEMNILGDNVNATGGGGGVSASDFGNIFDNIKNIEIPSWVKTLASWLKILADHWKELAAIMASIKLASWIIDLAQLTGLLKDMSALKIFGMLAGIAVAIYGIYETIVGIIQYIKDPSWANFNKILSGIETVLIGVGIAMVSFNASNPVGWIVLAVGAVSKLIGGLEGLTVGLGLAATAMLIFNATNPIGWITLVAAAISGLITVLSGEERQAINTQKAEEKLKESRKKVAEVTDEYVNAVDDAEAAEKRLKEAEKAAGISGAELYKLVEKGTLDYKNMSPELRELYKAYLANKEAQDKLAESTKNLNKVKNEDAKYTIESEAQKQAELSKTARNYEKLKETVWNAVREGKISAKEAMEYMRLFAHMFSDSFLGIDKEAEKTFITDIPSDIKQALDPYQYKGKANSFISWWKSIIKGLDTTVKINVSASSNTGSSKKFAKGGIVYPSMLPRLAVGGVINQPGRGVPIASAIGGERGAEGVIPLTDSQQMALLGEAIGKYITINASITNTMNGRVISKELQRINNENDFAYNR